LLQRHVFGNPHSNNPTSQAITHLVEQARTSVLEYFHASPDDYVAIFTLNASGALKLVGEAYPFGPGDRYLLTYDNHNSVNGIREFARAKGATVTYTPVVRPDMRLDEARLAASLDQARPGGHNLFAYPAQSNFSGVQHPLEWVARAQAKGWDVLLDCAAFAPTNCLDLRHWQPDFIPLSFYKIFGYPTGVGCLLARRAALARLRRPWFAGGTISITSVQGEGWHYLLEGAAGFEDGTVNYLNLPAVEIGLKHITAVGMAVIHERVTCLTGWLLDQMLALHHDNGAPLVRVYGPIDLQQRGGTIAFNLYDPGGIPFNFRRVEALAHQARISLRTGCFCNPGAGEVVHSITKEEMRQCFTRQEPMSFDAFFALMHQAGGKYASTMRVSVGLVTNFADIYRFLQFVHGFVDQRAADIGLGSPNGGSGRDTA
jgi:molybdenum cofactor sulfurtransferase